MSKAKFEENWIPYGRHDITEDDIQAVVSVLESDFLTQGPVVGLFEQRVAEYCGASGAVATSSATAALHVACKCLDVGRGDWVWTSPNTFVATANCARYLEANIDFVDIDPKTFNISIPRLAEKLEIAEKNGRLPKVVIPVHFGGLPCDMVAFHELSVHYGFKIIEDASHALGAYQHQPAAGGVEINEETIAEKPEQRMIDKVGSCLYGDFTVFSFHPVKMITTGEGGMLTSRDPHLLTRARKLVSHGIEREKSKMLPRPENEIWNYQQVELGFNYRMSEVHAALGLSQLARLEAYVERRNELAAIYSSAFTDLPLSTQYCVPMRRSSYHLYSIRFHDASLQQLIFREFWEEKVMVNVHYIPVHRQPYYERLGFKVGDFPAAESFHRHALSLPMFPTMRVSDQERVIEILTACLCR